MIWDDDDDDDRKDRLVMTMKWDDDAPSRG